MSNPIYLQIYSNGDVWVSNDFSFTPGVRNESSHPTGSEAGTLVKAFKISSGCIAQKLTVLTGSGNSSASALAATNGSATKNGTMTEVT